MQNVCPVWYSYHGPSIEFATEKIHQFRNRKNLSNQKAECPAFPLCQSDGGIRGKLPEIGHLR